jgi:DNA-binding HxlR family transcriptional regulator
VRVVVPIDERRLATQEAPRPASTTSASAPPPVPLCPNVRGRSPVEVTAGLLRGRWTAPLLWHLYWGGKSFYQLLRELDGIGRPTLAHELEEMEKSGLVERRFLAAGPRVVYALTALGDSLKPVVGVMYEWGLRALATNSGTETPGRAGRPPQDTH